MGVDRILQLKLIADVGDINKKMGPAAGQVEGGVGRMKGAFASLKSFAGPAMASIALDGIGMLTDAFSAQLEHARELRDAFLALEAVGNSIRFSDKQLRIDTSGMDKAEKQLARLDATDTKLGIDTSDLSTANRRLAQATAKQDKLRTLADTLRDIGVSLGVGEDAKIVGALREVLAITRSFGQSQKGVEAIFDAMRAFDTDFDTAKGMVINGILLGRSRQLDALGVSGDTAADRLKDFNRKYGEAAEDFSKTTEGKWQVALAKFDGHLLNAGILVDNAMSELKVKTVLGVENLETAIGILETVFDQVAAAWGPMLEDARATIDDWVTKLDPILRPIKNIVITLVVDPFRLALRLLSGIWKLITGDVRGFTDDVTKMIREFANTLIDLLNDMSGAFAFSFKFEVPKFEIPDPTQLLEGGKITIGGGTVDFSRGRLFDRIPHLAEGGIVRSPTLALLGEGAGPEAVVPLGRGGMMGNSYTINVSAPASAPADVGRAVVEAIEAFERRAGASWRR